MTNRLAQETSPYLLEHAANPVDWYPWGPEALDRARVEQRPILLSIGYSACHWCHVMARESFMDPEVAEQMNRSFVCIKVDREERPDLDQVYMRAVQGMTGSGGWPMTVFLLPDGTPFFGGTYFPPTERFGMPSFRRVLAAVVEAFTLRRAEVLETAAQIRNFLARPAPAAAPEPLGTGLLDEAYQRLQRDYDRAHGGFGGAPKFPQPMLIDFLLRTNRRCGDEPALAMAVETLHAMAAGGIYDQLGGGFHRYAVDGHWLVPHFEKMLYDNALLARAYLDGWQRTGDPTFRRVVLETLDFVSREMTSPDGGFYASLDADSEGEEGRFYLWTPQDLRDALGAAEAAAVAAAFDVTDSGNFEGRNILHPVTAEAPAIMDRARARLLEGRSRRVRPHRDEKVLAGWNGLMLRAIADAARILDRPDLELLATRNARFLRDRLTAGRRMLRSYKDGRATLPGYLEDQASVADGLLATYTLTLDSAWLDGLRGTVEEMIASFWDPVAQAFFDTAADHETLVVRPQDTTDNAIPSGTAMAIDVLLRAGTLLGEDSWVERGRTALTRLAPTAARAPLAFGRLLAALDFELARPIEIAIVGESPAEDRLRLLDVLRQRYLPNVLLAGSPGDARPNIPILQGRTAIGGRPTAYLCEGFVCQAPTTDAAALAAAIDQISARTA
ncbi:MAG: thioredoxin domain-containing protein [Candidatus Dormibacteraeota bacterium]|nr:thioredoxin domain-containing protein [Candidatus Dormibacteraeota bacterium]